MSEPTPASLSQADVDERQWNVRRRTGRLRRVGCGLLVPLWFMLLLLPCALFYLAVNGEIRIWHDNVPDPYSQPRLLVSLVSEMDDRGLRVETSSVFNPSLDNLSTCVESKVRFLLWQSQGGNQDVTYCECYVRDDEESAWAWQQTYGNSCSAAQ